MGVGGKRGAALGLFILLAGCAQDQGADRPVTAAGASSLSTTLRELPAPPPPPPPPPPSQAGTHTQPEAQPGEPSKVAARAMPKPPASPGRALRPNLPSDLVLLRGMAPVQVRRVLGEPNLLRRDTGVEVWQYQGADCVLDLFLYREGGGWRVLHHHLRSTVPDAVPAPDCLQEGPEAPVSG